MKLRHQAPRGQRIKSSNFLWMEPADYNSGWVFNYDLKQWERNPDLGLRKYGYSTADPCNSVRAFRRRLKKLPKGVKFTLISRFDGHEVYGKGSKES